MTNAKLWIENNPGTGSKRPFEVWFQAEGHKPRHVSSSATMKGAEKSKADAEKRSAVIYNITP